jgi:hypothetical protein
MIGMSTLTIPVLSGFRQSSVSLGGSSPVRAWIGAAGGAAAVVPHMDLIRMVRQEPLLRVTFLANGAVLSRPGSDFMAALPLVFLEGVGLKSYDLSEAGLSLSEVVPLAAAA